MYGTEFAVGVISSSCAALSKRPPLDGPSLLVDFFFDFLLEKPLALALLPVAFLADPAALAPDAFVEPPLLPFLLDDEFLPPEPDPPDPPLLPPLLPLPPPEEPRLEPLLVLPELAPPEPPPEDALPPPPARAAPPEAPPPPPPEEVDSSSSSSSSSSLLAELPRLPLAVFPRLVVPPPEAELLP